MEHLETLDNQEGVHNDRYERIKLEVCFHFCSCIIITVNAHSHKKVFGVSTNEVYEVFTYQVREEKMRPPSEDCRPSKVYKEVIVEGALEHALPTEYVKKLKSIKDNGYGGYGLTWNIDRLYLTCQPGRVDAISRPVC